MELWRLLVDLSGVVWTYVVAAPDHQVAWRLVLRDLPVAQREAARLEELERTGERHAVAAADVVQRWLSAPLGRPAAGSPSARCA